MSVIVQHLLTLQIIFYCLASLAQAEKMLRPKFKEIKLWSDEKMVNHKITYDANDPHLNFTLEVLQELNDVDLRLEGSIINKQDAFYSMTVNSTINLCRILNWSAKSPVGSLLHGFMKEYGKTIDSCPVTKGKYNVHKFWWPEDSTVAMLPEVDFDLTFTAFHLDANKQRSVIINNHITGEFIVQDVNNVKPGILAMLPKVG